MGDFCDEPLGLPTTCSTISVWLCELRDLGGGGLVSPLKGQLARVEIITHGVQKVVSS